MAKTSTIEKEKRKHMAAARARTKRAQLKANGDWDALQKMKRSTSPVQSTHRCKMCGRARGVWRKFGLCRAHLREAILRGDVPGVVFSSW